MQALQHVSLQDATLNTGRIQAVVNDVYMVVGPLGMVRAKRAAGCLLAPQKNDLVLLMLGNTAHYVLHVLERQEHHGREDAILLPPHTTISTAEHNAPSASPSTPPPASPCTNMEKHIPSQAESFTLQLSTHSLSIQASSKINMTTKAMNLQAQGMAFFASVLHMRGGILHKSFASIRTVSAHMFSRIAKYMALFDKKVERVDDLWDAKAKKVRVQAENTLRLSGEDTQIRAKETASVDAKHINIG